MNATDAKIRDSRESQPPRQRHIPAKARLKPVKAGSSQLKCNMKKIGTPNPDQLTHD
jgi:hypothetical protein